MATTKFAHVDPATGKIWNRPALYDALQAAKAEAIALRKELQATQGKESALIPWERQQANLVEHWRLFRKEERLLRRDIRWGYEQLRRRFDEVKVFFN